MPKLGKEVEKRFGVLPNFFRLAPETPEITEKLWGFAQAAYRTGRVKRWDGPRMILRWTAAALLWAEKTFRRINGCEQLKDLQKVLHELETTSTLKAA